MAEKKYRFETLQLHVGLHYLSIGTENIKDLIEALDDAFAAIK